MNFIRRFCRIKRFTADTENICYGDRPLACFFRRKNEKNSFTIIYMYMSI